MIPWLKEENDMQYIYIYIYVDEKKIINSVFIKDMDEYEKMIYIYIYIYIKSLRYKSYHKKGRGGFNS